MVKKDLTKQRFNQLTVISRNKERDNGYFSWLCKCDCGNTISVDTRRLKRGTIKNCGCIPKENKKRGNCAEDITNQRFHKLIAIERKASKNGRTRWLCKCDCGNYVTVATKNLKEGKTKSCGCIKKEKPYGNWNDLSGKRFGKLEVVSITEKRDYKGLICWKCKCDCGNIIEVSSAKLVSKDVTSCGCKKKEINKNIHNELTFIDRTCIEFIKNRKDRKDNVSGFRGISKRGKKYRVNISFQGKNYYLGTYENFETAKQSRLEAEEVHNRFTFLYEAYTKKSKENPEWKRENPFEYEVTFVNSKLKIKSPLFALLGGIEKE